MAKGKNTTKAIANVVPTQDVQRESLDALKASVPGINLAISILAEQRKDIMALIVQGEVDYMDRQKAEKSQLKLDL